MLTFVILAFVFGIVGFSLAAVSFAQTTMLKKHLDALDEHLRTRMPAHDRRASS